VGVTSMKSLTLIILLLRLMH